MPLTLIVKRQREATAQRLRRRRFNRNERVFRLPLNVELVDAALMIQGDEPADHQQSENALTGFVTDALLTVMHDYQCESDERKNLDRIAAEVKAAFAKG